MSNIYTLSVKSLSNEIKGSEILNSNNIFVFFSPPNITLDHKYNNYIMNALKNDLQNNFTNLINNIKTNGINRNEIINFEKELHKKVSKNMLSELYNKWRNNRNESFLGFLQKNNNELKSVLLEKLLDNFQNDIQIMEGGLSNSLNNKISNYFDNNNENMDIQLFIYTNKNNIPIHDLNFNTEFNDNLVKGGLYNSQISLESKTKDIINDPSVNEIKKNFSNKDFDQNYTSERFNTWYNNLFSSTILPEKESLKTLLTKKNSNMNIKSSKLYSDINTKVNNSVVLCFFHKNTDNKNIKPSVNLEKKIKSIYKDQNILLNLNTKNRLVINNNLISVNNDFDTINFMNKINNDTTKMVQKIPELNDKNKMNQIHKDNFVNNYMNQYIETFKNDNTNTEDEYKQKYFKYKNKYLNLKKQIK